jgi:signal peptidase
VLDVRRFRDVPHVRVGISLVGTFVATLILSLAGVAAVATLLPRSTATVVASGSMQPALREGDVLVYREVAIDSVGKGAVVVVDAGGQQIVHRVVDVHPDGSLSTKGDANASTDSFRTTQRELEGAGVVLVPWIGLPRVWWQQRQFVPLLLTVAIVIVGLLSCRVATRADWRPPSSRSGAAVAWLFQEPPPPVGLLPSQCRAEILHQARSTPR